MKKTSEIPKALVPEMIPITRLVPSQTNPRKRFNPEQQTELEASMRQHGFTLSAILVRPMAVTYHVDSATDKQHFVMGTTPAAGEVTEGMYPTEEAALNRIKKLEGRYEIVVGERRYRAAKSVGIEEAPCLIRKLSDQEVQEQQLVENVQRADLTLLEEAECLRNLLELHDDKGVLVYTTSTLAARIAKSARYVEQRVKLCSLDGEARKAVEDGVLSARTAMLIANIPDVEAREKFATSVLHPAYQEEPLSFRAAEAVRREKFLRDLRGAPWDLKDANLNPIFVNPETQKREHGGACSDCPCRSGNTVEAAEMPSAQHNLCLMPACYESKRAAGWRAWQAKETDPARNRVALSERECGEIYASSDQLSWRCGLVDLDEWPDSNDLKPGAEAKKNWRKMTKGAEFEVIVARDRNGKTHELVRRETAIAAATINGYDKIFKRQVGDNAAASTDSGDAMNREVRAEQDRRAQELAETARKEREIAKRVELAVIADLAKKAEKPVAGIWLHVIDGLRSEYLHDADVVICAARGWIIEDFDKKFAKLPDREQFAVIVQWLFLGSADLGVNASGLLKLFGVNAKAHEKLVKAAIKAEEKKKPEFTRVDRCRRASNRAH